MGTTHSSNQFINNFLEKQSQSKNNPNLKIWFSDLDYKRIFNLFDKEEKGYLTEEESLRFFRLFLFRSGNYIFIENNATRIDVRVALLRKSIKNKNQAPTIDYENKKRSKLKKEWRNRLKNSSELIEYSHLMLNEVDPKVTGKLEFSEFKNALWKNWDEIIKKFVEIGPEQREMLISLREMKKNGTHIYHKDKNRDKDRKKEDIISKIKEAEAIDQIWDEQLDEEKIDKLVDDNAKNCVALTAEGIASLRASQISKVSEVLSLKPHVAQKLLDHSGWNEDKLMTDYFTNKKKFLRGSGVNEDTIYLKKRKKTSRILDTPKEHTCSICLDETNEFTALEACGHAFCNGCWQMNLEVAISEGRTLEISCMHQGCKELVPAEVVESLVSDEYKAKYSKFLSKSFVNHQKRVRWCPAPGCEYALMEPVTECKCRVATCKCGARMCWDCDKEAHPPVTCKMLKKWNKLTERDMGALGFVLKNKMDVETLKWLHDNTKPCSFCSTPIQKNSGCFYMQCTNCHKSFCWYCGESWDTHGDHYFCSKLQAGREKLTDKPENLDEDIYSKQRKAVEDFHNLNSHKKLMLERFTQNYPTFATISEKENSTLSTDEENLKKIVDNQVIVNSDYFLTSKVALKKAWETLKYSYIHLSFLPPGHSTSLLELFQETLKSRIESLAANLKQPKDGASQLKSHILLLNNALDTLLERIENDDVEIRKS